MRHTRRLSFVASVACTLMLVFGGLVTSAKMDFGQEVASMLESKSM